jgi:uncharacterized membrane protein
MKASSKIIAIIAVIAFFATAFYLVCKFVDASNAGLHGGF